MQINITNNLKFEKMKNLNVNANMSVNETKVVCPACGTEIKIADNQSVQVGVTIGKDSGLGTVVLPAANENAPTKLSKAQQRIEAMKKAGIDTSTMFAMESGDVMKVSGGIASVMSEDELVQAIMSGGTVADRHLFRRWVMAQTFRALLNPKGFNQWLREHGLNYQWRMISNEIHAQCKMRRNDTENYAIRNGWFNMVNVYNICREYTNMVSDQYSWSQNHIGQCEYILCKMKWQIQDNNLHVWTKKFVEYFEEFRRVAVRFNANVQMSSVFIDCYKGVGAYYTMQNMILFHGATFKGMDQKRSMEHLNAKNKEYRFCTASLEYNGYRLHACMKKLIQDSGMSVSGKIMEWRKF